MNVSCNSDTFAGKLINPLRLSDAYMLQESNHHWLALGRCQAIIWTNAVILLTGPLGMNYSEILIKIYTFSFQKMHFKMWSGKGRTFCLDLNVLTHWSIGDLSAILEML